MVEPESKPKSLDETFRDYVWGYFELHADQRLKAFQFYISLSTALVGGFLLLLRYDQNHKWMSLLGFLLAFLSFVFWKLDHRTKRLVKNAEDALKFLDAQHDLPDVDGMPHPLRIFTRDDYVAQNADLWPLSAGPFSYSRCFKWVFVAFALLGLGAGIACLILFPV